CSLVLSYRLWRVQSDGLAVAVRIRRLVRARRRQAHVAHPVVADHAMGVRGLSRVRLLRHDDLVRAADEPLAAEAGRAVDVSDRQDRSRRVALRAFPRTCSPHRALPAEGLAGAEISMAEAADPLRPAFAGDILPR